MKKLFLLFPRFSEEHMVKDVYLFPYYVAKGLNMELNIIYDSVNDISRCDDNIEKFHNLKSKGNKHTSFRSMFHQLAFIFKKKHEIDVLILFHFRWYSLIIGFFFKILKRKKGYLYIKADMGLSEARANTFSNGQVSQRLKSLLVYLLTPCVDFLSVETSQVYNVLIESSLVNRIKPNGLHFIPNGYEIDDCFFTECKKNMMINVGRIGSSQKNIDFLLNVLSKIEFNDWVFYFIGPINDSFLPTIDLFYKQNPSLLTKVIFTGEVNNTTERNEFYKKAKVFVFTSLYESYGLVLLEAAYFNDYIITTDVGAASDLILGYACAGEILGLSEGQFITAIQNKINDDKTVVNNKLDALEIRNVVSPIIDSILSFFYPNK